MSGYGPFDDFTLTAMALAIILSAIVSLIGTSGRRRSAAMGEASALDLCELTGITDPKDLQETFGPPDMGRIWRHVTLEQVHQARRPLGWVISSNLVDWLCMGVATLSFFYDHVLLSGAVMLALIVQITGWVAASRLPR
jgi:hypothetical protein